MALSQGSDGRKMAVMCTRRVYVEVMRFGRMVLLGDFISWVQGTRLYHG